jgi:GNAT superfamily N-acetyltransferase
VSYETTRYTADHLAALVALLARVGTTQLSEAEFAWWFERNPAGEGIVSLAVDDGEVVGVAAMSFFRTMLGDAVTRLAIPVNVATDPRYRGQGVFSTLERENEAAAAATGAPLTHVPERASYPIPRRSGGSTARLRLGRASARARVRLCLGGGEQGGLRAP